MTQHNGRPPIKASDLGFAALSLRPGEKTSLICPDCRRWRFWKRGMIRAHDHRGDRCAGSNQRVEIDVSPAEWLRTLPERRADARLAAMRAERITLPHARSSGPPALDF